MTTKPEKIIFYTDTEEVEFYVVEQTRINDVNYILVADSMEDDAEALILKEVPSENAEEAFYDIVEDEKELTAVAAIFEELLDDIELV